MPLSTSAPSTVSTTSSSSILQRLPSTTRCSTRHSWNTVGSVRLPSARLSRRSSLRSSCSQVVTRALPQLGVYRSRHQRAQRAHPAPGLPSLPITPSTSTIPRANTWKGTGAVRGVILGRRHLEGKRKHTEVIRKWSVATSRFRGIKREVKEYPGNPYSEAVPLRRGQGEDKTFARFTTNHTGTQSFGLPLSSFLPFGSKF